MSLSDYLVAPDGFTRLDRHLVVSLWSAPRCAPTVVMLGQQFIQLATARVSCCSCKHVPFIAVHHQTEFLVPASCHTSSCSGAHRTGTVQMLSGLILARCLTRSHSPPSSYRQRIPEFRGVGLLDSTSFTDWIPSTPGVSVARSIPVMLSVSRSGWPGVDCPPSAASSTSRPSCLRQHEPIIVPTWLLSSAQAWSCAEMHAQCDTIVHTRVIQMLVVDQV